MFLLVVDAAPRSFSVRRLSKHAVLFAGVSAVALFVASDMTRSPVRWVGGANSRWLRGGYGGRTGSLAGCAAGESIRSGGRHCLFRPCRLRSRPPVISRGPRRTR
jgi:hypothetical protein